MSHKKTLLCFGAMVLLGASTASLAQTAPTSSSTATPSVCEAIANDSLSDIQSDASTVAPVIAECINNNVCSQITGVTNCAGLLSTRDFLANYTVNLAALEESAGTSNSSGIQATAPRATAPPTVTAPKPSAPVKSTNPIANPKKSAPQKSINWF